MFTVLDGGRLSNGCTLGIAVAITSACAGALLSLNDHRRTLAITLTDEELASVACWADASADQFALHASEGIALDLEAFVARIGALTASDRCAIGTLAWRALEARRPLARVG